MSRHGPSRSASICWTIERADLDGTAIFWPGLARIRGGIVRIGDVDHHGPAQRPAADPLGDLLFEEVGAALREVSGRDRDRLRRRQQRPSHRILRAGTVGEDEAVETVEPLFGVAAGPRGILGPGAERRNLGMRASECLHRVRVFALRGEQQLVKGSRRRDRKEWWVDHGAAPFLPVRRRDPQSDAPHPDRRIRRVRICRGEIEASEGRILAAGENLRL